MSKKVVVFDMDGVIFDTVGVVTAYVASQYVGVESEVVHELSRGSFSESLKNVPWEKRGVTEEEIIAERNAFRKRKELCPLFRGIKEVLEKLSENYLLVLNTSASVPTTFPILERNGLKELFSYIATRETAEAKSEKFRMIKEKFSADSSDIIFVTDTVGDAIEALLENISTIGATWDVRAKTHFSGELPSNIVGFIDDPEKLPAFIEEFFASSKA